MKRDDKAGKGVNLNYTNGTICGIDDKVPERLRVKGSAGKVRRNTCSSITVRYDQMQVV